VGVEAKLLFELSGHATGQCLSGVAFAAWKLPVTFEMYAPLSAGHEKPTVTFDDRRANDNGHDFSGL
jgi:hypothetical protein